MLPLVWMLPPAVPEVLTVTALPFELKKTCPEPAAPFAVTLPVLVMTRLAVGLGLSTGFVAKVTVPPVAFTLPLAALLVSRTPVPVTLISPEAAVTVMLPPCVAALPSMPGSASIDVDTVTEPDCDRPVRLTVPPLPVPEP